MPLIRSSFVLSLLIASSASAVAMDWTPIGNPGNTCDPLTDAFGVVTGCPGAVPYPFEIGTYEVTNAQYAEFLNAKATSDPLGLYSESMSRSDIANQSRGGIERSGSPGSYTYSTIAGRENLPVVYVSFYDALRFANWMNNGQGTGSTENGAYTLLGATAIPSNGTTVTRNAGATIVLANEDEWTKAAFYAPGTASYFDYPTADNMYPTCTTPTATANSANCGNPANDLTPVGSYPGAASSYGTFDQAGNAGEWTEVILSGLGRISGGSLVTTAYMLDDETWLLVNRANSYGDTGLRLAMIPGGFVPEPSTGLLVVAGLLGLAARRRGRA